jgi:sulfonate transport system substrate-binding protein
MKTRRRLRSRAGAVLLVAAFTAVAAFAGTSPASAAKDEPDLSSVTLTIGQQGNTTAPFIDASGVLKGAPYTVNFATFAGPAPLLAALDAKAIDGGGLGDFALNVAQANAATPWTKANTPFQNVVVTGPIDPVNHPLLVTLAGANSGIKSLKQLRGKKWSYTPGSNTNLVWLETLKKAGLTPTDISPVQLDFAVGATALANGDVDAWTGPISYAQPALAAGAKVLATATSVGVPAFNTLVARTDALKDPAKAAAFKDFAARYIAYQAWIVNHQSAAAQVYVDTLKQTPDQAKVSALYARQRVLTIDPSIFTIENGIVQDLIKAGLVKNKINVALQYNPVFNDVVAAAAKKGGLQLVTAEQAFQAAATTTK